MTRARGEGERVRFRQAIDILCGEMPEKIVDLSECATNCSCGVGKEAPKTACEHFATPFSTARQNLRSA